MRTTGPPWREIMARTSSLLSLCTLLGIAGCIDAPKDVQTNPAVSAEKRDVDSWAQETRENSERMLREGRDIFRYDTFGSEAFWGGKLRLHEAIAGSAHGGVGNGVTAHQALQLGLKVDIAKLPRILAEAIRGGHVSLEKVDTTLELLRADAVVGVKAIRASDGKTITSVGITCALCHSTVDDSFAKGIGRRLDGWPNRDLDVGAIVAIAPDLSPLQQLLGADRAAVTKVLKSWGPGKYDAELDKDGKAMRPDGRSAATVIPAAFGLAGQNLHTYNGWGSVPYWNAYVGITQMHGSGVFFDRRLNDAARYPVAARNKLWDIRPTDDRVTAKLPALHFYQLSIPAPKPKAGSFDAAAASRGKGVFEGRGRCATCHVPPIFSEPGWPMHTAAEIGIDDFQARRSPDGMYRTTPLAGLFVREKGGFYHDGRFNGYRAVVDHYDGHLRLGLSEAEKGDLIEYLKSL
jgi:mono/diheme cytochrome c family protein